MNKCQCEGCDKPAATGPGNTGKYCSLSCGSKQAALLRKRQKIKEYELCPKLCLECGAPLHFEKRNTTVFCNQSCAASYNNARKDYTTFRPGPAPSPPKSKEAKQKERQDRRARNPIACVVCGTLHSRAGRTCSDECCSKIQSENAIAIGLGGNKNTRAYGWYESPSAGRVWLESSYEYNVAKDLDEHGIRWTRPRYLPYTMDNKQRKYYPDFYLTEHNVYLDPKNDYLITQDQDKIDRVIAENNVSVVILDKQHLSWDRIKTLI